jgi:hypothetical protein
MKKFLLSMLTCCVCAGAWAQGTAGTAGSLNVPEVMRNVGGTPTAKNQVIVVKGGERQGVIKIKLTGSSNCRDMQFDLTLPEGITLAEAPTTEEPVKMVDEINDAKHVLFYALDGQTVKIAVVDKVAALDANVKANEVENATSYGQYLANDIVFELPIAVASSFEGVKDATISNLAFTDDAATADIAVTGKTTFGIDDILLGDVDDSGKVNVQDITTLISKLQNEEPVIFVKVAADIDENDKFNVQDVTGIVAIIQSQSSTSAKKYIASENTEIEPE